MSYSNSSRHAYANKQQKKQSTDITVKVDAVTRHLLSLEKKFNAAAVHAPHISFQRECIFAKHIINNNNVLTGIAVSNPQSFETAFLQLASSGLTLDPAQKQAYLVPRDGRVILDISYIGLCRMATDEGLCQDIVAELVFEHDTFKPVGRRESPIHEYDPFAEKGDLLLTSSDKGVVGSRGHFRGAYVDYLMKDGRNLVFFIDVRDLAASRAVSESWRKIEKRAYSPWTTFPWKMVLKSAIKQTIYHIPGNRTRLSAVIDYLNIYGEEGFRASGNIPMEAAQVEMAHRQAAQAANDGNTVKAATREGSVIEGEVTQREKLSASPQPETTVADNTQSDNTASTAQSEHSQPVGQSEQAEPQEVMSDVPGVRLSVFKRVQKLVTRAQTTLAYETIIAELKRDTFAFNDCDITYACSVLEQSRRDQLSNVVHNSMYHLDFTQTHDFVDKLADSEFKANAFKWVAFIEEETMRLNGLYNAALNSGDYSQVNEALQSVQFAPLKEMLTKLINTAKAA
ncbi:recombinase RecT [Photorhabdus aegyptia]|uniref:Recombinational DNA repair protein (RecE pathway) n=1 Tax=Photorhabdus aegyptia TaxID=2805098 RepID=A0A022PBT3_9GAMM|nr:recombinase RecT [Photorhabdus aegyptia]EYU13627.1 recombinational DNA repair protein (RecE pathway) [Photorhabdus aegyptia]